MATETLHTRRAAPRWAVVAAYLVPISVLPSALWRCSLLVNGTIGMDAEGWYVLTLSIGSIALATLTLGLVHSWGERLPRWAPMLGGRTVPPAVAVVPAMTGAVLIIGLTLYAVLNGMFHFVEQGPVLIGPTGADAPQRPPPGQGVLALYVPMLAWGPLLLAVTLDYRRRRRRAADSTRAA